MVQLKDLTQNKEYKKQVRRLYKTAFPANERMPFFMLYGKANRGKGSFFAACDRENFVGLAYAVVHSDVVYLFFLAVDGGLRGRGYGSEILQEIKRIYSGKRIILNIEELVPDAANYEGRLKRKEFYERNGFRLAGIKSREATVVYDMMVCGGDVTYEDYAALMKNYSGRFFFKLIFSEVKQTK